MKEELDYTGIQPTMHRTVRWMRKLGFHTTDSGDGVTNVEAGMEGALEVPHVVATVAPLEGVALSHRLLEACRRKGLPVGEGEGGVSVEFCYLPGKGVGLLTLWGVTDAMLPEED